MKRLPGDDVMYFPYMRAKQYELTTVRETATVMARARFVPVIASVHEQLRGIQKPMAPYAKLAATCLAANLLP